MNRTIANYRNEQTALFFSKNGIEVYFIGHYKNPLIVNSETGEVLNCSFSKNGLAIIFKFNEENPKKIIIQIENLFSNVNFNFSHWFNNSSKKKIYVFLNEGKYFCRYDFVGDFCNPLYSNSISDAYFVFNFEKAFLFQQKMLKFGIILNILKKWKIQIAKIS